MPTSRGKKGVTAANGINRDAKRAGELAIEPVSETYDALADVYAEKYEAGNPDQLFLDEFLSHLKKRAPRPGPRDRQRASIFLRPWHAC